MIELLESLARRREALAARSARQRKVLAAEAGEMRRAATEPLVLGLGVAVTLFSGSPRLRWWFVRAWVAGAFLRRLLGR
jgi:hypothetical protein